MPGRNESPSMIDSASSIRAVLKCLNLPILLQSSFILTEKGVYIDSFLGRVSGLCPVSACIFARQSFKWNSIRLHHTWGINEMNFKPMIITGVLLLLAVTMAFVFFILHDRGDTTSQEEKDADALSAGASRAEGEESSGTRVPSGHEIESEENLHDEENTATADRASVEEDVSFTVWGRILDEKGDPLEGVEIDEGDSLEDTESTPWNLTWQETGRSTDRDGRYGLTFPLYKLPSTHLRFRYTDYQDVKAQTYKAMPCYDGSFFLEDIHLTPLYMICVLVKDKRGAPVEGCSVG